MPQLTAKDKAHVKVIVILAIVGLLLEKINEKVKVKTGEDAASQQIGTTIDELLKSHDATKREVLIAKIQKSRIKLTKSVKNLQVENAFIGALEVLTDGTVKTSAGTRLDWVVQNFRNNVANIKEATPYSEAEVAEFRKRLMAVLRQV